MNALSGSVPVETAGASNSADARFEAALAAIDLRSRDTVRSAAVAAAKAYLAAIRREAEDILTEDGGFACARHLSAAHDAVVAALYQLAVTVHYPPGLPTDAQRVAVVAVGGFGRGTLAPGSDIDILFLLPTSTAWGESIAEAILYPLWDIGLKVGHATRTVEECVRSARDDLTVSTALLEARFLCGDRDLFQTLRRRYERKVMSGRAAEFVQAKLAERDERVLKAGVSRYLVEPNVKEGKGGFRDLQTLFWIAKFAYRITSVDDLVFAGVFTRRELHLFKRCEEFLWRVRCHMHFATGRAEERLTFDMQRIVAARMRYRGRGVLSAVERFMKHYFLVAKEVGDLSAIVCAALESRQAKPSAMLGRFFGRLRRDRRELGTPGFFIDSGRINVASDDVFRSAPTNLIRIFWLADQHNLPIHPDATRIVTLSLRFIDTALRENTEANRLFLDILTSRRGPEPVLRLMHECGVLGRFVPDFARINAMMQFSMYHHYTVDEHTLRCLGALSALEMGRLGEEHPVAHAFLPKIQSRTVLYVALFLHDIGKGRAEAHEQVGARIARELCPRLGLAPAETETVAWLVEHHLVMSQTAQGRDLADSRTIASFAETVQTLERLRLLLVLTICDIRAVGPGVWNGWKGQLLRTLYWEAEIVLTGGETIMEGSRRVAAAQDELKRALTTRFPHWTDETFGRYAGLHHAGYWLKVELERKVRHAELIETARKAGERFRVETSTDPFRGVTELVILALDHPRLLAIITGACAAAGANIVEAQIFTTSNGFALDTILISRAFSADADELRRADRVAKHVIGTLKGEIRLPDVVASRRQQTRVSRAFDVPAEVTIDNSLSARATVVEVTGLDRPGLLYELTTEIGKLNLNIVNARIVTYGEKAVDVFYLTDLTGGKLTAPPRQSALKRTLLSVLAREGALAAPAA